MVYKSALSMLKDEVGVRLSLFSADLMNRDSRSFVLKKFAVRGGMIATSLALADLSLGPEHAMGYEDTIDMHVGRKFYHGYDEIEVGIENAMRNRSYWVYVLSDGREIESMTSGFRTDDVGSGGAVLKVDPNKLFAGCYQLLVKSTRRFHSSSTEICYDPNEVDL